MNTSSPSLQDQLLARVAQFLKQFPTITQAQIARYCGIGESNFSAAIARRRGLGANACLQLHTLLGLPRNEVIKKFSQPERKSHIVNFQRHGQSTHFDADSGSSGSWVPGLIGSGTDINSSIGNSIDTPTARDLPDADDWISQTADVLRTCRGYHRKAIRVINSWLLSNKVNQGSTAPNQQRFSTRACL